MSETKVIGGSLVDVGWGRLVFAHTFPDPQSVADVLLRERPNQRDIAFYVNDPQLVLSVAPQDLFLDPSTTYRLNLNTWRHRGHSSLPLRVTNIETRGDINEINRIYNSNGMVPVDPDTVWQSRDDERFNYFVARPQDSERIIGVTLGVDHVRCFDDLFNSSSLWALAVDPQTEYPACGYRTSQPSGRHFCRTGTGPDGPVGAARKRSSRSACMRDWDSSESLFLRSSVVITSTSRYSSRRMSRRDSIPTRPSSSTRHCDVESVLSPLIHSVDTFG